MRGAEILTLVTTNNKVSSFTVHYLHSLFVITGLIEEDYKRFIQIKVDYNPARIEDAIAATSPDTSGLVLCTDTRQSSPQSRKPPDNFLTENEAPRPRNAKT